MGNLLIVILAFVFFVVLIVSLYFLFKKKGLVIEEEIELINISEEVESRVEIKIDTVDEEKEIEKEKELKDEINLVTEEIEESIEELILDESELEIQSTDKVLKPDKEVELITEDEKLKLSINISSKTEKVLLDKLSDFENSKGFLNKEVNLNFLAKIFNTNTKYLSEIIKSYKNKNFNQYLNELRIDYLIMQLNADEKVLNTKVSYLASDFGFNSHSSFSTIFTQYVGKSPSEYIKELKQLKSSK